MHTAKLFMNGGSQAVRLPKECRFEGTEVYVRRVGSAVILYPKDDPWALLRESLDEFSDDFLPDGRPDQGEHEQREPF
jgi:antitoxin VapB